MSRRYRRRIIGLLPRLGQGILALARWLVRHPQPLIVLALLCGALWGLWVYVHRDTAFRIANVHVPADSSLRLPRSLIGTNIWELNLRALSEQLKRQQPWLKEVLVIRELPNSLRIDVIERATTGQVRLDQWYPVDQEGFILPQGRAHPWTELVRLRGTDIPRAPLRSGELNTHERLHLALRVLETLRSSPTLAARQLRIIDVSDPRQINFVIDEGTEIRCGSEDELDGQLERLARALDRVARQRVDVRYIDVRFQEPVVSPRT